MKLKDFMQKATPDPNFNGFITNNDIVLAIDSSDNQDDDPNNYIVVGTGIQGVDYSLNAETQDTGYLYVGKSTTKTATQFTAKVTGDRYVGDEAQDYILSHKIAFGTGAAVVKKFVAFCFLTGKGYQGKVSIIVNSTGAGSYNENAKIDIDFKATGVNVSEYEYKKTA